MIFDDGLKDDPRDVDILLSNELMRLSIGDRNAIQEEIHGVRCLAPEETPELLQSSLHQLAFELDRNLPREITRAYRQSQHVPATYVNTLGFRLRFLRCELFDVPKAARRMASFLNMAQDFFGDYALERPIRLSDMNKEELKYMRSGRVQWLPFRDRSGRRIVVIFPGMDFATIPMKIKQKITLYMCWTGGNDVDTQRKGIVIIVWYDRSFKNVTPKENKPKLHELATIRICALHCCTPDTPYYRFRRAVMTMRVAHLRMNLRCHMGNTVELIYILQGYGIPTDTIPITYSGTVKVQATRQWMRLRTFLEEPIYQNTEAIRSYVECPFPNDIVFRQGTSILAHTGNANFRGLIATKFDEIESMNKDTIQHKLHKNGNAKEQSKMGTRVFVKEIMEEMQRTNRRVLNWSDAQGCWKILTDQSQIYMKVEYLVREHKNAIRAQTNRQWSESSTSLFCNSDGQEDSKCGGCAYCKSQ